MKNETTVILALDRFLNLKWFRCMFHSRWYWGPFPIDLYRCPLPPFPLRKESSAEGYFFSISNTIALPGYLIKWALKANVFPQGKSKLQWEGTTATYVGIPSRASTSWVSVAMKPHLSRLHRRLLSLHTYTYNCVTSVFFRAARLKLATAESGPLDS